MGQAQDHDEGQLVERLAERYGKDLVQYISRRVRSMADARDLAQEAYVRLLRLERKDLIRDPRPYLFRIAANILYEFELKRKADVIGLMRWSAESRGETQADVVERDMENMYLRDRLESVLQELSAKCRAVLILHRRDGMTYDEIGAKIGISASMVKKYLAQGLQHCRKHLKDAR